MSSHVKSKPAFRTFENAVSLMLILSSCAGSGLVSSQTKTFPALGDWNETCSKSFSASLSVNFLLIYAAICAPWN